MNAAGFQIWTNKWQSLWCCLMQLWQWLTPSHWSQCWSNIHQGSKSWSLGELTASKPGKTNGRYNKLCQFWFVFSFWFWYFRFCQTWWRSNSSLLKSKHWKKCCMPKYLFLYWSSNVNARNECQRKEGEQHFAAFIVLKSSQSILFLTSLLHWQCELQ